MKILKNAGSFVILTPEENLKSQLLTIERAGRTCYQSVAQEITQETAEKFVKMILKLGHESVMEHSLMIVQFNDCSRGLTHELVRHRLMGISQESTRYVDYAKPGAEVDLEKFELKCVVPAHKDENEKVKLADGREMSMAEMLQETEEFYRGLRKAGWLPQDARQILPTAIKSQIVVSANLREWRHIFKMRTARPAHWEIREVMGKLLEKVKTIIPVVFEDFVEAGKDENGLKYFEKISRS